MFFRVSAVHAHCLSFLLQQCLFCFPSETKDRVHVRFNFLWLEASRISGEGDALCRLVGAPSVRAVYSASLPCPPTFSQECPKGPKNAGSSSRRTQRVLSINVLFHLEGNLASGTVRTPFIWSLRTIDPSRPWILLWHSDPPN